MEVLVLAAQSKWFCTCQICWVGPPAMMYKPVFVPYVSDLLGRPRWLWREVQYIYRTCQICWAGRAGYNIQTSVCTVQAKVSIERARVEVAHTCPTRKENGNLIKGVWVSATGYIIFLKRKVGICYPWTSGYFIAAFSSDSFLCDCKLGWLLISQEHKNSNFPHYHPQR